MNTLYKHETEKIDALVKVCLAPFTNLTKITFEAVNILDDLCGLYNDVHQKYMGVNGRNLIHNTIYDMEEKYDQELSKLYKQFNIKNERYYDLPEKERKECGILYHKKPIFKMILDFTGYAADHLICYKSNDVKDNPFALILAGYARLYGDSMKWWMRDIKDYENKSTL